MSKITDNYKRVAVGIIKVDRESRQRRDLGDLDELAASIQKHGVLNPIIVTHNFELVAGERRLTACIGLGLPDIPVRFVEQLTRIEREIIELEENIKRTDLCWQDSVNSIARIHHLFRQINEHWTQTETAEECNVTSGLVSIYLAVNEQMTDERVAQAGTVNEAYNIIKRRDQRAMGDALTALLMDDPIQPSESSPATITTLVPIPGGTSTVVGEKIHSPIQILPAEKSILIEDFNKWVVTRPSNAPKFNFVHCDFPYGIDLFDGPQGRGAEPTKGYMDQLNLYESLIETFCKNIDKFMAVSAHCIFWYAEKHRDLTRNMFKRLAPTLDVHHSPLVWVKSDNAGISSDPRHGPRHIYETALFITRGRRQILKVMADAKIAPTEKLLHPSTKPEPVLKHFFEMVVDQNSTVFDPTCGSGSALRAAEEMGARTVLGLEVDPQFAGSARAALNLSRMKNLASRKIGGLV